MEGKHVRKHGFIGRPQALRPMRRGKLKSQRGLAHVYPVA